MWSKRNPPTLLVGRSIGAATMENSMGVSQNTKNRVTVWSSTSILEHVSSKDENPNLEKYVHPSVQSSTTHKSLDMEATKVSIKRRTDKENVVYMQCNKKEWNNTICNNLDAPRDYHTKRSESWGERQMSCDITYMWKIKIIHMNLCTKQK